jgi:FkbM family methyltransferase
MINLKKIPVVALARLKRKWSRNAGVRRRRMIRFYRQFIRPGDLVFDVGAHTGSRTSIFLHLAGTSGKIVAFEPQRTCAEILCRTFACAPNVVVVPEALGTRAGTAEMMISNAKTVSTLSEEWIETARKTRRFGEEVRWDGRERIVVDTLDNAIEKFGTPSFIKIDVEGYEKEVLAGLSRRLRTVLSIEFVPELLHNTETCLNVLSPLNSISCNFSLGETFTFALGSWVPPGELLDHLGTLRGTLENGDIYVRLG